MIGDCTTVNVGSSEAETKTVAASPDYICPNIVNKENWLGGGSQLDTFSIQQRETDIVVTRTDNPKGWGMNLSFRCCGKSSYMKNGNAFVL